MRKENVSIRTHFIAMRKMNCTRFVPENMTTEKILKLIGAEGGRGVAATAPLESATAGDDIRVWPTGVDSLVVDRRTGDREVAGSSLTHCAVDYGPAQAAHALLPLSLRSSITLVLQWRVGDTPKPWEDNRRSGVAMAMRHSLYGLYHLTAQRTTTGR